MIRLLGTVQTLDSAPSSAQHFSMSTKGEKSPSESDAKTVTIAAEEDDVFGPEEDHDIQYKTLSWQVRDAVVFCHPYRHALRSMSRSS